MRIVKLFLLLFGSIWLVNCGGGDDPAPNPTPTPTPVASRIDIASSENTKPTISQSGGSATLTFTANNSWTASSAASWCTISPSSGGSGTTTLTINVVENDTYDDRTSTITIKSGTATQIITVSQVQKDAIILALQQYEINSDAQELSFSIQTNVNLSISFGNGAQNWISQADTRALRTETLNFNISANESLDAREGNIIIAGNNITQTVTVRQEGTTNNVNAEKDALMALYYATDGSRWTHNANWGSDRPLKDWYGLEVNSDGHVWSIDLSNNNLNGELPDEIGQLTYLTTIHMGFNPIKGEIPETIGNLKNLSNLFLRGNQLSGSIPASIGNLAKLTFLTLDNNELSGSIPESIGNLKNLSSIELYNNNLSGEIPESFGNLKNLTYLGLMDNSLTGSIPESITNLSYLESLGLGNNQFSGSIPENICNLTKLEWLGLEYNNLSGNIPASLGATITETRNGGGTRTEVTMAKMSKLKLLVLNDNHLTGTIPSELGNLASLENLSLQNNNLTGNLPESFANLNSLTNLGIEGNNLSGVVSTALQNSQMWKNIGSNINLLQQGGNTLTLTGSTPPDPPQVIAVTGVTLSRNTLSLRIGETANLVASVIPSNATDNNVTWSSSNTSVVTVSNGLVTAVGAGMATITVTTADGGKTATCTASVEAATVGVSSVVLNNSTLSMTVGGTATLFATINPSNATNQQVIWTSSDAGIATVDTNGVVKAVNEGSAIITVTTVDGGKTATCIVQVEAATIAVTGVTLSDSSITMTVGGSATISATVAPSNATDKDVNWNSSNPSVATVNNNGVITAVGVGTATITVTTSDGNKTATCSVTVKEAAVAVTGVSLNNASINLTEGETATLTATVAPSNASVKDVTWSSSDTSVVIVSNNGVVTAVGAGTATITVTTTDGNKTATCSVTVKEATIAVTGVHISKTAMNMTVGDKATLSATIEPSNATNKNIKWESTDSSVITVDQNGTVTAVGEGSASVIVSTEDGNYWSQCVITVQAVTIPVESISLNFNEYTLEIGHYLQLEATIYPENATNKGITWSSSNTEIAALIGSTVQAIGPGIATITATTENGITATCTITVPEPQVSVTGILLNKTSVTLKVGEKETLIATILPTNATNKNVKWTLTPSYNSYMLDLKQDGTITGLRSGNLDVVVTTEDGNYSAMCKVYVVDNSATGNVEDFNTEPQNW